jgi:hypothetical protein
MKVFRLTEQDGGGGCEVGLVRVALDGDHGNLEASAPGKAGENLVADPLAAAGADVEGVDQASGDCSDAGRTDHDGSVYTRGRNGDTRRHGGDSDGNDEGQVTNTRGHGRDAVDGLEEDGQVVDEDEVSASEEEGVDGSDVKGAFLEEARGDHGALALPDLESDEDSNHGDEADEQTDDGGRVPRVLDTAVLQSQKEGDGRGHHERGADRVHLE